MNFYNIFSESLDTFRVFDNLKVRQVGERLADSPKTIWETLNHLIIWQSHQLDQLINPAMTADFDEKNSWISFKSPDNQQMLDQAVQTFVSQTDALKALLMHLTADDILLEEKLKVIQNFTSHLSFHLGEIILQRRLSGDYPMPDQMSNFLK